MKFNKKTLGIIAGIIALVVIGTAATGWYWYTQTTAGYLFRLNTANSDLSEDYQTLVNLENELDLSGLSEDFDPNHPEYSTSTFNQYANVFEVGIDSLDTLISTLEETPAPASISNTTGELTNDLKTLKSMLTEDAALITYSQELIDAVNIMLESQYNGQPTVASTKKSIKTIDKVIKALKAIDAPAPMQKLHKKYISAMQTAKKATNLTLQVLNAGNNYTEISRIYNELQKLGTPNLNKETKAIDKYYANRDKQYTELLTKIEQNWEVLYN